LSISMVDNTRSLGRRWLRACFRAPPGKETLMVSPPVRSIWPPP